MKCRKIKECSLSGIKGSPASPTRTGSTLDKGDSQRLKSRFFVVVGLYSRIKVLMVDQKMHEKNDVTIQMLNRRRGLVVRRSVFEE